MKIVAVVPINYKRANVTRGGKLEIFPRESLENVIKR